MSEFHPYFTSDGSVGLYNEEFNDIYHSATGALTEANEKFIYPINFDKLLRKNKINVLDICYGIGYNTKSFLNKILSQASYYASIHTDNNSLPKHKTNIVPIYTDNIVTNKLKPNHHNNNNAAIHTDNIFSKISITAVDNDKVLSYLSPFVRTGVKNFKKQNLNFEYEAVRKYLTESAVHPKIDDNINFVILDKIIENSPEIFANDEFKSILYDPKYNMYFEPILKAYFQELNDKTGLTDHFRFKLSNLHNIYYRYLSNRYKKAAKSLRINDFNFRLIIDDARKFIKEDNYSYDLIFLDAFSPNKCPCLWSYEFFVELYKHLEADGMLLTYSTSAAVRAAMIEAGFSIGNIYNERLDKFTGTIAVKNIDLIKYPLSEYDLGLLKTRAGIFYRDENLTGQNEAIIAARNLEVKNSDRLSSSKFMKENKML